MAFDTLAILVAGAFGVTAPADDPTTAQALAGLTLDYDRIAEPVVLEGAPVALALAKTCSDPWWKMSGIQLATCMIAHPEETFGTED
jgi:hypothetical protein